MEGLRAVRDVFEAGILPELVVVREDFDDALIDTVHESGVPVRIIEERLFTEITDVTTPQGVLAVVPMRDAGDPVVPEGRAPFYVIIDGVRDPGNLGTLFRSAAGAGVDHVFLTPETVDPYNPKTIRAAMGSHLRVRFSQIDAENLGRVVSSIGVVGLAEADGDVDYDVVDWTQPAAIVVGGEAFGPTSLTRTLATTTVSIPLTGGVESLNAAVAGSLMIFEVARQRRVAEKQRS